MLKPHDKGHHEATIVKRGGGKHAHDEHGGAWKVAFADFCLALMCLFLVLWLMAARNTETLEHILTEADGNKADQGRGVMSEQVGTQRGSLIERTPLQHSATSDTESEQLQPNVRSSQQGDRQQHSYESPEALQLLAQTLARLSAQAGLANNLEAVVTPYGLRVLLHDTDRQGMFVRGSAIPTDKFTALLNAMAPVFAAMDNQLLIVGHTDSKQYADTSYAAFSNWNLSSNRAMAARAQLLHGQMPQRTVLQVVGMADRAPLDPEHPDASPNRRIELLILTRQQAGQLAAMFGIPDGKTARLLPSAAPEPDFLQRLREKLALPEPGDSNDH